MFLFEFLRKMASQRKNWKNWSQELYDSKLTRAENVLKFSRELVSIYGTEEHNEKMKNATGRLSSKKWIDIDFHTKVGCEFYEFIPMLKHCLMRVSVASTIVLKVMYCAQIANAAKHQMIRRARELNSVDEASHDGIMLFLRKVHGSCFGTLVDGVLIKTGKRQPSLFQRGMVTTDHFLSSLEAAILEIDGLEDLQRSEYRDRPETEGIYLLPTNEGRVEKLRLEKDVYLAHPPKLEPVFRGVLGNKGL
jgi:hypothetical protein